MRSRRTRSATRPTTWRTPRSSSPPSAPWRVSAKCAIDELKEEGINVGHAPSHHALALPDKALHDAAVAPGVKAVLDVELNAGQMLEDVKLAVNGEQKVDFFGHYGSQMPTPEEIKAKLLSMREVL